MPFNEKFWATYYAYYLLESIVQMIKDQKVAD